MNESMQRDKKGTTGEDPINAYCHSDSRVNLCIAICLQLARTAHQPVFVTHPKGYHCPCCLTCLDPIDLTTDAHEHLWIFPECHDVDS